mmetsp:Transcript_18501/g.51464  ORF Transcript_18501/g.51464 Transcript_18501/m.51464 type:complete len:224 (-) Transcript_18501:900-1571(-)
MRQQEQLHLGETQSPAQRGPKLQPGEPGCELTEQSERGLDRRKALFTVTWIFQCLIHLVQLRHLLLQHLVRPRQRMVIRQALRLCLRWEALHEAGAQLERLRRTVEEEQAPGCNLVRFDIASIFLDDTLSIPKGLIKGRQHDVGRRSTGQYRGIESADCDRGFSVSNHSVLVCMPSEMCVALVVQPPALQGLLSSTLEQHLSDPSVRGKVRERQPTAPGPRHR